MERALRADGKGFVVGRWVAAILLTTTLRTLKTAATRCRSGRKQCLTLRESPCLDQSKAHAYAAKYGLLSTVNLAQSGNAIVQSVARRRARTAMPSSTRLQQASDGCKAKARLQNFSFPAQEAGIRAFVRRAEALLHTRTETEKSISFLPVCWTTTRDSAGMLRTFLSGRKPLGCA